MRIIINECKKILDIRIILLLCMFSILYYMTFTQIYLYPTGGQVTNTKYDIPFTAELVKEWGPKWKVKDEKQYQEKHQELERGFAKIIKQDQELSKRGIVDYEIFNKKYEEKLCRNILGVYETGTLELRDDEYKKEMSKIQNIDAVILGCTELPLIFEGRNLSIPSLDTMQLHIQALIQAILEE